MEFTVPFKDRVAAAHDLKTARYASLMSACETNGFKAIHFAFEVGSRGSVAHSLLTAVEWHFVAATSFIYEEPLKVGATFLLWADFLRLHLTPGFTSF